MSVHHILVPVSDALLKWGRQCGVTVPADTPDGRIPTIDDIKAVLESLTGYTYESSETPLGVDWRVASVRTTTVEFHWPDPIMEAALGGTRIVPEQSLDFSSLVSEDGSKAWTFHGDMKLMATIIQRLAGSCGPLAVFSTCDGVPAFFLPDQEVPIWREPWY